MNPWELNLCVICEGNLVTTPHHSQFPAIELIVAELRAGGDHAVSARRLDGEGLAYGTAQVDANTVRESPHLRYVICGNGHLFFAGYGGMQGSNQPPPLTPQVVAMIGSPAAGKSYLLIRTLHQSLPGEPSIRSRNERSLTNPVFASLSSQYTLSAADGTVLTPTGLGNTPGELIPQLLDFDDSWQYIVDAIHAWNPEIDDAKIRATWRHSIFQPVIRDYQVYPSTDNHANRTPGHRIQLYVTDLAGEQFTPADLPFDMIAQRQRAIHLAGFDALVWTIDTAICDSFREWADDGAVTALLGSLRPEKADLYQAVEDRRATQEELATTISDDGFNVSGGGRQEFIVTIAKADLFHHTLANRSLAELGATPGLVRRGIERYLRSMFSEGVTLPLFKLVNVIPGPTGIDPEMLHTRIGQLSQALVSQFSNPDIFWNLVETGEPFTVTVDVHEPNVHHPNWEFDVMSEAESIATQRRFNVHVTARTAMISALGAGLCYGLGLGDTIDALLQQRDRRTSFAVVSALGGVPSTVEGPDGELRLSGEHADSTHTVGLANARDNSAGLQHLLMSMIRRVAS
ncbi:hypothetical protein [Gordonia alkaliphila]|uniref:Uncharacterized protein n=1 Tax=Gordonia alkaliphila TaxID=1053547 RepID=A0ABP8Z0J7_9ACTN